MDQTSRKAESTRTISATSPKWLRNKKGRTRANDLKRSSSTYISCSSTLRILNSVAFSQIESLIFRSNANHEWGIKSLLIIKELDNSL